MAKKDFDIERVAELAKLKLTDEQKKRFGDQLNDILGYVEKLNELDTDGIEPLRHVLEISTPLREDKVKPSMGADKALMNAPASENGFFKTPKIKD
ncbi:Asp-tRNA(Asn)/Glu-tRNA(Gln) amidotransferase subunit GatC [candidate division KSB1 bacterium]